MKVSKIEIQNYKTIRKLNVDLFRDISLIVGKNNIGKSNVLKSIEIFFNAIERKKEIGLYPEDFRKNSSQITLIVTFSDIDKLVSNLQKSLVAESTKKRSNQDTIKHFEQLYRIFQMLENRYHELSIKLIIPRSETIQANIEIVHTSESKDDRFKVLLEKRYFAEKYFIDKFKEQQQNNVDWFEYNWLVLKEEENGNRSIKVELETIDITEDKYNNISDETIKKITLDYITNTQKFFYVPAYRGGKTEREEAINKLFDILIDDLVTPKKGNTTEYDNVTDAIWGTGKNSSPYNLQKVISNRLTNVTNELRVDSISSIKDIQFRPFSNEEIRRKILKTMLGSSDIFLDDGINTSFESKGTGIQSSFMITLMKALSKIEFEENVNIILVVEEPEAFAHPQLIREIIDKISREFEKGLFQFIITTHSPVIVNFVDSDRIQRLKLEQKRIETINITNRKNISLNNEDWNLINRIGDVNLSEIVFSDLVIFVEGEGDRIVFEKLLRIVLPDFYSKLSIISLSGNKQIFKLLKLLNYYEINWLMIFDKDSFVDRGYSTTEITTENDLTAFFQQFQIGKEFQDSFKSVINNQNISAIKIARPGTIKIGETLSKISDIYLEPNVEDVKKELLGIISKKLTDDVFPERDSISITSDFNKKLKEYNIPFYSLMSELEGMVINEFTLKESKDVFQKYYEDAFVDFEKRCQNASKEEYLKALKKAFGSKTHNLEAVRGSARDRKKPHIPIEIVSNFIDRIQVEDKKNIENIIFKSFPDLSDLTKIIIEELQKED
jgi:predicted ATP-dependent endonuclease of OLD family